jgi:hypothetical protein
MVMISEEAVDNAWQTVSAFEAEQAADEMHRISEANPELLAFVSVLSEEMTQEAQELAYYMFVVIYTMFDAELDGVPPITHEAVADQYEKTSDMMDRLAEANGDEEEISIESMQEATEQPWVMKYVVESLIESQEGEDPIELSDDDFGNIMLILTTLVEVLHEATAAK